MEEGTYLKHPKKGAWWCGWVTSCVLVSFRGEQGRPFYHAARAFNNETEAQAALDLCKQVRVAEGFEEAAPPVPPSALQRDPELIKRMDYTLAFGSRSEISVDTIDAAIAELAEFFTDPAVKAVTALQVIRPYEGGFQVVGTTDDTDLLEGGLISPEVWAKLPEPRQKQLLIGGHGLNGWLNPQGKGSCSIRTGFRMSDFAMRLFIERLQSRAPLGVTDSRDSEYPDSLFEFVSASEAEWYPVYQDVLKPALIDRGWMKMDVATAFALAAKKGTLGPRLVWG
jgi:hypothetical protein